MPHSIIISNRTIRYKTAITLYYNILNIILFSEYYEYDKSGDKWLKKNYSYHFILNNQNNIEYKNSLPYTDLKDKEIIGLTSLKNINIFYDEIKEVIGINGYNGFNFIDEMNKLIGRINVPYTYSCKECNFTEMKDNIDTCPNCGSKKIFFYHGIYVPYFLYITDIPDIIKFMEDLKNKTLDNCCELKRYENYGGDLFLDFLKSIKIDDYKIHEGVIPTIDLPILITSEINDLGQYRTYNVDIVDDNSKKDLTNENSNLIITSGESKLKTLRRRKISVDDNGNELPFIIEKDKQGKIVINNPYKVGYIKNIQLINNNYYGDLIYSMKENSSFIESIEEKYSDLISYIDEAKYLKGTANKPLNIFNENEVNESPITLGDISLNKEKAYNLVENDFNKKINTIKNKLLYFLKTNYPNFLCLKQEYVFNYKVIYGEEDINNTYENELGEIITPIKKIEEGRNINTELYKTGNIFVIFNNPQIEITYVLGGKLKEINGVLEIDDSLDGEEKNPFEIKESEYNSWNGSGIWYKETYPLKKLCINEFLIDGNKIEYMYDEIDFSKKEIDYYYNNIDFTRKNYILCNDIRYKSESYLKDCDNDFIFKDEKMVTLNYPLKENFDVTMDRGCASAFEKHLQLTEIKTWKDLESYRNGSLLNK